MSDDLCLDLETFSRRTAAACLAGAAGFAVFVILAGMVGEGAALAPAAVAAIGAFRGSNGLLCAIAPGNADFVLPSFPLLAIEPVESDRQADELLLTEVVSAPPVDALELLDPINSSLGGPRVVRLFERDRTKALAGDGGRAETAPHDASADLYQALAALRRSVH